MDELFKHVLGFDPFQITRQTSYPPHNVITRNDSTIRVEVAAAGFSLQELDVTTKDGELTISGKKDAVTDPVNYIWKGIGTRSFEKKFVLEAGMKVQDAGFTDGILWVEIEKTKPKDNTRRITIK